ncbi:MAG: hypothetical protein K2M79_04875 [Muribaculaceae bacterium]|nr:hypothetical protein [Muribaculaceae bacterium]
METVTVNIVCPSCNEKLTLVKPEATESGVVTCLRCGHEMSVVFDINSTPQTAFVEGQEPDLPAEPVITQSAWFSASDGSEYEIPEGVSVIGRCDARLASDINITGDSRISRRCAQVEWHPHVDPHVKITVLKTKNPIIIGNDIFQDPGACGILRDGESLYLGQTRLTLRIR